MDNNSSDKSHKRPPLSLPFYYGWFVISLCFLTTLTSAGVRSSPSVLIHPLEAEFGWSRTLIASAVSMNLLLFGIAAPLSGFLIDRFGPRKVMMGSLSLLIVGVSGTMMMTQFWQFFLVWGVIVGLGAGGVGSVLTATVGNRWFVAKRGLALGILGSASSTGQIIFLPLFMAMITYAGWRLGSMALIIVALILLPLIFLFMRDDPSEVGLEPYGAGDPKATAIGGAASLRGMSAKNATITAKEVVTHPTFWLLAASFFVCGGTANGLIGTHLIPHEIEIGIPQIAAASLLGIMGGLNMVGTIFSGWMIDKVQPQRWLALVYALRGVSLLIFALRSRFHRPGVFRDYLRSRLVCHRAAVHGDHRRHFRQAKRRQSLWLDFHVAPDRRGDHGFGGRRHPHLDGRLSVRFSVGRRDRDDRGGTGIADQVETEGSGATRHGRGAGGSVNNKG